MPACVFVCVHGLASVRVFLRGKVPAEEGLRETIVYCKFHLRFMKMFQDYDTLPQFCLFSSN